MTPPEGRPVLTAEQAVTIRELAASDVYVPTWRVVEVCDSHEQLRAERDEARHDYDVLKRNGLNAIRLTLDEVRDPAQALAVLKEDHAALRDYAKSATEALAGHPNKEARGGVPWALREHASQNQTISCKWTAREQRLVDWALAIEAVLASSLAATLLTEKEGSDS